MKKQIANHFHYCWWAYLILILVVVIGWSAVFSALARPAYNEKITVDFFGRGCNILELTEELQEAVPPLCSRNIRQVAVKNSVKSRDSTFYQTLQARNYASDAFIFTGDFVDEHFFSSLFAPLDEAKIKAHLGDVTFYCENGRAYGIVLNPEGVENCFTRYYTGDQQCILAFASESVNLAGLFGKGDPRDDGALVTIRYLLKEVQ